MSGADLAGMVLTVPAVAGGGFGVLALVLAGERRISFMTTASLLASAWVAAAIAAGLATPLLAFALPDSAAGRAVWLAAWVIVAQLSAALAERLRTGIVGRRHGAVTSGVPAQRAAIAVLVFGAGLAAIRGATTVGQGVARYVAVMVGFSLAAWFVSAAVARHQRARGVDAIGSVALALLVVGVLAIVVQELRVALLP